MRIQRFVLVAATLYQLVRFVVLFFLILLAIRGAAASASLNLIIALAAPALIVVLLMVQLLVTGAHLLIPPLSVAVLVQLTGAVTALSHALRAPLPIITDLPGLVPTITSIVVVADFAMLLFLLIYGKSAEVS